MDMDTNYEYDHDIGSDVSIHFDTYQDDYALDYLWYDDVWDSSRVVKSNDEPFSIRYTMKCRSHAGTTQCACKSHITGTIHGCHRSSHSHDFYNSGTSHYSI